MSISHHPKLTAEEYDHLAREYYRTLPLEHFMESTPQATQREIVLASLALLKMRRRDFRYFSDLLVQYWHEGELRRVVPDNMVVLDGDDNRQRSSFAVELEDAPPFLVIEYVSPSSEGKDYEDSFRKYEQELRVPYCAMYYPERQDLRVHRLEEEQYVQLEPDTSGRIAIPELDLQVGLRDGWMRFWHNGELLDLPADLARRIDEQAAQLEKQAKTIEEQAAKLQAASNELDQAKSQLAALTAWLRTQVQERAAQAGRQDLVEQSAGADAAQLQQWLNELK